MYRVIVDKNPWVPTSGPYYLDMTSAELEEWRSSPTNSKLIVAWRKLIAISTAGKDRRV